MNVKRIILIVTGVLVLFGIFAAAWVFFAGKGAPAGTATTTPVTLPGTSDVPGSGPGGSSGGSGEPVSTLSLPARGGGSVVTNDFIQNGVTKPDTANVGRYLLAGDLGYCATDPSACQAASTTDFNIFYDSKTQSFTIGLLKEPLGTVRDEAEQFLEATLGIAPLDLCRLTYYVGTPSDVNDFYSSKNLGFKPCPGATELP